MKISCGCCLLRPGVGRTTKAVNNSTLSTAPPAFTAQEAAQIVKTHFDLDATANSLVSERDQNFHIDAGSGLQFVLKIANPSEDREVVDFQVQALRHVAEVDPGLPLPRVRTGVNGSDIIEVTASDGTRCFARMVNYLSGTPLGHTNGSTAMLQHAQGRLLARLGRALRGYFHPAAHHALLWDLRNALQLRELLSHITDAHKRGCVEHVLDGFESVVQPVLPGLRAQVIHNDLNPGNLLVDPDRPDHITGIIDFGDLVYAPLIIDVAVAAAYQLAETRDPLQPIAALLSAYHCVTPLEETELAVLFDLLATRVAMTVVISSWRAARYPENSEYILTSNPRAVRLLEGLAEMVRGDAEDYFRNACALPVRTSASKESDDELIVRRERLLGPSYRLFYDHPLHFVRGEGVWLYDPAGRAYLDVYNNVPHVGHCHPRVVDAIARQAAQLNTHTRYLHHGVVDYAQRLGELLPFDDPVCLFCCSGSEANELAYRIAKAHTGATGVVVTTHAYHGNTSTVAQFSTADSSAEHRGDFVQTIAAPDDYRGSHEHGAECLAEHYASQVHSAVDRLRERNIRPAMLLVDTIFSCDGIVTPPSGFVARAARYMAAGGGLLVADEVQAGFGRTGEHLWGFERHDVVPDIVTLGKPMGNGYPLAAVVCPRTIVEKFAQQFDYFNTFGGNPVASAAGMAVLDVLRDQCLQQNALQVGAYLKSRLGELQGRHASIGDIRGAGLFLGIELVRDRDSLEPAGDHARAIVNAMCEQGVLIGATGPHGNVLKIRPPLVFSQSNADELIDKLSSLF